MRTASCHCGALRLACEGDPRFIAMCHCELCQRRTGTSYNLGAWFERSAVDTQGAEHTYTRTGDDSDVGIIFHFCPTCGTSVYWNSPAGSLPEMLGVAVGCFADPDFPAPSLSVYGRRRHHWLPRLDGVPCFTAGPDSPPEAAE